MGWEIYVRLRAQEKVVSTKSTNKIEPFRCHKMLQPDISYFLLKNMFSIVTRALALYRSTTPSHLQLVGCIFLVCLTWRSSEIQVQVDKTRTHFLRIKTAPACIRIGPWCSPFSTVLSCTDFLWVFRESVHCRRWMHVLQTYPHEHKRKGSRSKGGKCNTKHFQF